jgi:hypothetical protein
MKRDLRIDTIRGVLLSTITVTHLGTPVSSRINHLFGLFSFAEGLVFMSGFVTGLTCAGTYKKYGMKTITRHSVERFAGVYLGHIIPAMIILAVAGLSASALHYIQDRMPILADVANGQRSLLEILGYIMAILYQPSNFDIFPMFMLFMLLTPVFVYFLGQKRAPIIFALSGLVWFAVQTGVGRHWFTDWTINQVPVGGLFNPFAWQFLFLTGCYFGFHLREGVPAFIRRPDFLVLCAAITLAGLIARYGIFAPGWYRHSLIFSKSDLGILRLINFYAFVCLLAAFARRYPEALEWRWFATLGQHPLQVFSFQIVLVYLSGPLIWRLAVINPLLADSYIVIALLSLMLPALAHISWRNRRQKAAEQLAPSGAE